MSEPLYDSNIELLRSLPAARVPSTIPLVEELREALRGASRVLDVGCGTGSKTAELRAWTSASILGVDVNPAAIASAERQYAADALRFVAADMAHAPDLGGKFDVINMSAFLTCVVPRAARERMVRNAALLLSASGLLVVSDFLETPRLHEYRARYERGEAETREPGSFLVSDPGTQARLYFAHHFSETEIHEMLDQAALALRSFRKTTFVSAHQNFLDGFVLTASPPVTRPLQVPEGSPCTNHYPAL